jgi:hypothetical protein
MACQAFESFEKEMQMESFALRRIVHLYSRPLLIPAPLWLFLQNNVLAVCVTCRILLCAAGVPGSCVHKYTCMCIIARIALLGYGRPTRLVAEADVAQALRRWRALLV